MDASHSGHLRVVEVLIAAGADVRGDNGSGRAPMCTRLVPGCIEWCGSAMALLWAARGGHADIIAMLAGAGADRFV
jgi:hypothetical protein